MRDIKFRAWDGKKIVMVKSLEHIDGEDCITTHPGWNINNTLGIPEDYLMQFTGLKDKNGKEIYEGDIIKFLGWEVCIGKQVRPEKIMIIDDFIVDVWKLKNLLDSDKRLGGSVEVVGNIYESKHLLDNTDTNGKWD